MYKQPPREIPDVEGITQSLNVGRLELVGLASGIARSRNIKATSALFLLQSGEVTVEQAREMLVEKFQTKKIEEPKTTPKEDDTTTQS